MINKLIGIILLLGVLSAQALTIEVFTNRQYPIIAQDITRHEIKIYELDKLKNYLDLINRQLTALTLEQGKVLIRQSLQQNQHDLQQTMKGLLHAQALGIKYLPAVVVNRTHVIYGQTDLQQAVSEYQQWLSNSNTAY